MKIRSLFAVLVLAALALCVDARAAMQTYLGNGVGGNSVVGNGTLTLSGNVNSSISFNFTRGGIDSMQLDSYLVVFLDSRAGGFTGTGSFMANTSSSGSSLNAISGYNGSLRAPTTFASGFGADFALVINPVVGAELWQLGTTDHTRIANPLSGNMDPYARSFNFSVSRESLGMSGTDTLRFESTYMNPTGSRCSLESFEHYLAGSSFGFREGTLGDFNLFDVQPVPEMTNVALVIFGGLVVGGNAVARVRRHLRVRKNPDVS